MNINNLNEYILYANINHYDKELDVSALYKYNNSNMIFSITYENIYIYISKIVPIKDIPISMIAQSLSNDGLNFINIKIYYDEHSLISCWDFHISL